MSARQEGLSHQPVWWRQRNNLGLLLLLASVLLAIFVLTQDVNWQNDHNDCLSAAIQAAGEGSYDEALTFFQAALGFNPYSPEAHLGLGIILDHNFGDNIGALRHYQAALRENPLLPDHQKAIFALPVLEAIISCRIEDPQDAIEDMWLAVTENMPLLFRSRLGPDALAQAEVYWQAWRERGRGKLVRRRVRLSEGHPYEVVLSYSFPNGEIKSLRFACQEGEPWRLDLAFP
ncbi:MAG: hypothetical protein LBU79_09205 [Planctomycetota bacterium]|jgi:tetratricopeptide (TPR) repeat protein|nr:hypothetical protein [Planctomycetota bacterium]